MAICRTASYSRPPCLVWPVQREQNLVYDAHDHRRPWIYAHLRRHRLGAIPLLDSVSVPCGVPCPPRMALSGWRESRQAKFPSLEPSKERLPDNAGGSFRPRSVVYSYQTRHAPSHGRLVGMEPSYQLLQRLAASLALQPSHWRRGMHVQPAGSALASSFFGSQELITMLDGRQVI